MIEQLLGLGAVLTAIDPHVEGTDFAGASLRADVDDDLLRNCDLAVVLTDHDAFDYPQIAKIAPRLLDTRNRLRGDEGNVERL